ncbi:MAG: hypothetical protein R6V05_11390 [Candidatus Brocadiia bacterium]
MLRRIAVVSVSLLVLFGASSALGAEQSEGGGGPPSISELEQFASAAEDVETDVDAEIADARAALDEGKPRLAQEILDGLPVENMGEEQTAQAAALAQEAQEAVAELEKAEAAAEEVPRDQAKQARSLQEELTRKWKAQMEARQARAAELVKQGRYLLHYESKPREAYDLAKRALLLDPNSQEALQLKIDAGVDIGVPEEEARFAADKMQQLPSVREQSARQALENALARGRRLASEGKYELAIEQLRNARFIVESLAAYMDVSQQRQEVEQLLQAAQQDYTGQQRELKAQQKVEAEQRAEQWAERIAAEERKERGRQVEEVLDLVEQAEYRKAYELLETMEAEDPSDDLVRRLRVEAAEVRHEDMVQRSAADMRRGDLQWEVWEQERLVIPERLVEHPDKFYWDRIVTQRVPDERMAEIRPEGYTGYDRVAELYPSTAIEAEAAKTQEIQQALQDVYEFPFQDTPLTEVKEYLEQVTDVQFLLYQQDLPPTLITFDLQTSLENALDQITELASTSLKPVTWKVEGNTIKIGAPWRLGKRRETEYVLRVYSVLDLLMSFEDTGEGGGAPGGGGGGGGLGGQFDTNAVAAQAGGGGGAVGGAGTLASRVSALQALLQRVCADQGWVDVLGAIGTSTGAGGAAPGGPGGPGGAGGFGFSPQFAGTYQTPAQFPGGGGTSRGYGPPAGFGGPSGFGPPAGAGAPGGEGAAGQAEAAGTAPAQPPAAGFLPQNPGHLIVYDTPAVHQCIERVLKDLRATMKIQIHVDVRLLGVNSDFLREVGFQWDSFAWQPDDLATGLFDTFDSGVGVVSPAYGSFQVQPTPEDFTLFTDLADNLAVSRGTTAFPLTLGQEVPELSVDEDTGVVTFENPQILSAATPFIGTNLSSGTTGLNLNLGWENSLFNLTGFLRLAHQKSKSRTISAPQIMLANGQQSSISSSSERDIEEYEVDENILVPVVGDDPLESELNLPIRAVASDDLRYVFLELAFGLSSSDLWRQVQFTTFVGQPGGDGGASGATVQNTLALQQEQSTSLQTTVGVPDRGTIIAGGLTQQVTSRQDEAGVPILSKIPILKRLFSSEREDFTRSTTFVIAKPTIVMLNEEESYVD